jgi:hypothetical protein
MNFDETYQLLELLESDSERDTYSARERSTNSEVLIHLLSKRSDRVPSLLTIAKRHLASHAASDLQLKIGTFQNEDCLITSSAVELRSVRRALEGASAGDPFDKASVWKVPSLTEPALDTSSQEPKAAALPGEFTRMFQTPSVESSPARGPAGQSFATAAVPCLEIRTPPAQSPPSGDGSLSQMFSVSPSKSEPGEFTQMFQSAPAQSLEETKSPAPASPAFQQPGDFTRMFSSVRTSEPAPKDSWLDFTERPKPSDSLDSINWDSPQVQGATGVFAVPKVLPAEPSVGQGPSEFTRFMSVVSDAPKQNASPKVVAETEQPVQPKSPPQATSNLPVIITVNLILITVITLILYFVLRH